MNSVSILTLFIIIIIQVDCNIVGRRLAKVVRSQPRFHHHEHIEMRSHGHHHPNFRTVVHGKIHSVSALSGLHSSPAKYAARESASYHKGLLDGRIDEALRGHGHMKGQIIPPKVRMSSSLAHHSRPHQHVHVHHVHTHGARP